MRADSAYLKAVCIAMLSLIVVTALRKCSSANLGRGKSEQSVKVFSMKIIFFTNL